MNGYVYFSSKSCKYCKKYDNENCLCKKTNLYIIGVFSCMYFEKENAKKKNNFSFENDEITKNAGKGVSQGRNNARTRKTHARDTLNKDGTTS